MAATSAQLWRPLGAEDLTKEDIDQRLHRKRKTRGQKACYPCRQRKVGCNYATPCQKCVDRDHPELCLYDDPVSKKAHLDLDNNDQPRLSTVNDIPPPSSSLDDIRESLLRIDRSIQELRDALTGVQTKNSPPTTSTGQVRREVAFGDSKNDLAERAASTTLGGDKLTGESVQLGHKSLPAMAIALGSEQKDGVIQELTAGSILPFFHLDNESATYPFVDLWGLPHASDARLSALCRLIPADADCLQHFRHYRDTAHVLFPAVVDIDHFEGELTLFLIRRAGANAGNNFKSLTEHDMHGANMHWIGLLFAILASGCQCSSLPRKERQLTSQVYICCAYESLRIINYLSNPTLVDIENLLILGNVISNNMNASVTWCLLGLTIRLGQSLGLHQDQPPASSAADSALRKDLWWRILWQDSLISITFDRGSASPSSGLSDRLRPSNTIDLTYTDCMKILSRTGLQIVQEGNSPAQSEDARSLKEEHWNELQLMMKRSCAHLQDAATCRTIKDRLEHCNLYLHRSYIIAELFRPALKATEEHDPSNGRVDFLPLCIENLANTVDAFLMLQTVTRFATQSWAAVHRALSSALLLAIIKEPGKMQRVEPLLHRLIVVMSEAISSLDPSEVSAPIFRSLSALSTLTSQTTSEAGSETGLQAPSTSHQNWLNRSTSTRLGASQRSYAISSDTSSDKSPYAMMESILWGQPQFWQTQQLS